MWTYVLALTHLDSCARNGSNTTGTCEQSTARVSSTVRKRLRLLPIADLSRRFARPILSVSLAVITVSHTCCRCRDGKTILGQWCWSALARSCELGNCLLLPYNDLPCKQRTTPSPWRDPPIAATDLRIFVSGSSAD